MKQERDECYEAVDIWEKAKEDLDAQIEHLQAENRRLAQQAKQMHQVDEAEEIISENEERIAELELEVQKLQMQIESSEGGLKSELRDEKERSSALIEKVEKMERELGAARKEAERLRMEHSSYRLKVERDHQAELNLLKNWNS